MEVMLIFNGLTQMVYGAEVNAAKHYFSTGLMVMRKSRNVLFINVVMTEKSKIVYQIVVA